VRYGEVVRDHFHRPRNAFRLPAADATGTAGAPGRGPYLVLDLRLAPGGARIAAAGFQTYGCPPAIAAGSLLTERLTGADLAAARAWTPAALEHALGGLPMEKRHCPALAVRALRAALAQLAGAEAATATATAAEAAAAPTPDPTTPPPAPEPEEPTP